MEPLVSIVVPVYKVAAYLRRCVESLTVQSYQNIEILLVDDGSPDCSGEICDALALTDPRIRAFHKPNGGLSDARNYGTERALGEFVAYIDSDDFVTPNYVERLMELIRRYDADISCCDFLKTTANNIERPAEDDVPECFTGAEACTVLMGRLYQQLVIACGKLYRREIVAKYPFPVGKIHEDEATTCKFLHTAGRVAVCKEKLYGYFQNPLSITRAGTASNYQAQMWALDHRAEFFDSVNARELADRAWNMNMRYLVDITIDCKLPYRKTLREYKKTHTLAGRLNKGTKLKIALGAVAPWVLQKRRGL